MTSVSDDRFRVLLLGVLRALEMICAELRKYLDLAPKSKCQTHSNL